MIFSAWTKIQDFRVYFLELSLPFEILNNNLAT